MGRRALRKIDSSLDLSEYLLALDEVPAVCDSQALFANEQPLEVEVGSGKGLFLTTASENQPNCNFLGVEIVGKYARFSAAKLAKARRTNAMMIQGDGLRLFREHIPRQSLAAVHVYFPDPWWKKRHRKRRVMTKAFVEDIERTLTSRGALHFWTDVAEYFEETLELIAAISKLEGPLDVPEVAPEHDLDYRTHFERRMRQNSLDVFRAEFRKV